MRASRVDAAPARMRRAPTRAGLPSLSPGHGGRSALRLACVFLPPFDSSPSLDCREVLRDLNSPLPAGHSRQPPSYKSAAAAKGQVSQGCELSNAFRTPIRSIGRLSDGLFINALGSSMASQKKLREEHCDECQRDLPLRPTRSVLSLRSLVDPADCRSGPL